MVLASASAEAAAEAALVLQATGITHAVMVDQGRHLVLVPAEAEASARRQLRAFAAENERVAAPVDGRPPRADRGAAAAWLALLAAAWVAQSQVAAPARLLASAQADAAAMRGGEVWRGITALFLHADAVHVAGNAVFGAFFVGALAPWWGRGLTALALVWAAWGANVAAAWAVTGERRSIGASTAVFAAIGMLSVLVARDRSARREGRLRTWAPLVIGAVLVGLLGGESVRVDHLAHVLGLLAGGLTALLVGVAGGRAARRPRMAGALALATVAWAWWAALGVPPGAASAGG